MFRRWSDYFARESSWWRRYLPAYASALWVVALALGGLALVWLLARPPGGTAQAEPPVAASAAPPVLAAAASPTPAAGSRAGAAPQVVLQIGHWRAADLPAEQAHLRANAGATFDGSAEQDLNFALTQLVATELISRGIAVEIVPATVPVGTAADAFVSIHCDFASDPSMRGYKVGAPWRASPASLGLRDALHAAFAASGMPFHDGVNSTMRGYYAFNSLRYEHAVTPTTPAVIIEAGFMTNPDDNRRLTAGRAATARTIADGIAAFLSGPIPDRRPPDLPLVAPLAPLAALADPDPAASPVADLAAGDVLWTYEERGGWYHVVLPPSWDYIGWVPADAVATLPADAWRVRSGSGP